MWQNHAGIEITVFHGIAAAAKEMAVAAGLPRTWTDITGNKGQIDLFGRHPGAGRCFFVGAGRVMANQAVDVGRVGEVETAIFPTVADMTAGTAWFVRRDGNTKIVKRVDFSAVDFFAVNDLFAIPGPVAGFHDMPGNITVAFQSDSGGFRPTVDRPLDKRMVCCAGKCYTKQQKCTDDKKPCSS